VSAVAVALGLELEGADEACPMQPASNGASTHAMTARLIVSNTSRSGIGLREALLRDPLVWLILRAQALQSSPNSWDR
jgi:hypothetical protein